MKDNNVETPNKKCSSFERLKATKGAMFDYLYPKLKLIFETFNVRYARCLPISTMQSQMREYVGTSRFGRKMCEEFFTISKSYIMRGEKNQ